MRIIAYHQRQPAEMTAHTVNYTAFASFLSNVPDIVALKRFRELQIKNLLFYQAELAHLEVELAEIEQRDAQDNSNACERASFRWKPEGMREASLTAASPAVPTFTTTSSLFREKMLQIRRTLASYSELWLPLLSPATAAANNRSKTPTSSIISGGTTFRARSPATSRQSATG
jgi:hypothetical protein